MTDRGGVGAERSGLLVMLGLLTGIGPVAAQSAACPAIADTTAITTVGAFSDMRYTEEHAYGHAVILWRAGTCLFGLFESSQGVDSDMPIGELHDVAYDPATGRLSFSATLTMGMVSVPGARTFAPSCDVFTLDGALRGDLVAGTIAHAVRNVPTAEPTRVEVVLRRSAEETELMGDASTLGVWRDHWRPILRRRGPKC
jgi:hypothetical protein